jgi:hypothetical protein
MLMVSCLLLFFLFYKEWKRKNRDRLGLRLLASGLAVGSLLFAAFPYTTGKDGGSLNKVIVLTDGFNRDSLQLFLKQASQSIPLFSGNRSLVHAYMDQKIEFVPDLFSFFTKHATDTLHVFGNGFSKEELDMFNDRPFVFHAAPAVPAIQSVYWKKRLATGQTLVVQGKYKNPSAGEIKILLRAFNENLDSVLIPAKASHDFVLKTIPKHTGKALYSLIAFSTGDTLQNEPLPVAVEPAAVLKMLVLSSAPDFENTFFKNRFSQNGYSITIKTAISKNKSDNQFLNMQETAAVKLTGSYLDQFDLVMADDEALRTTSAAELAAIRLAIEEKGMGLLVRTAADKSKAAFYTPFFPVYKLKDDKKTFSSIHSPAAGSSGYSIKIEEPACIRYQPGTQMLLQDPQSNIYASSIIYGQGKIAVTTLNNTYTLALAGNNYAYQSLWSLLLEKTAKKKLPAESWQTSPQFSFVNEPTELVLETGNELPLQAYAGSSKIYFKQNERLPYQAQALYWPEAGGWQPLKEIAGRVNEWYVYKPGDWSKSLANEKLNLTKKYAFAHNFSISQPAANNINKWLINIPLYLLILFLACCGFLWMEQKIV